VRYRTTDSPRAIALRIESTLCGRQEFLSSHLKINYHTPTFAFNLTWATSQWRSFPNRLTKHETTYPLTLHTSRSIIIRAPSLAGSHRESTRKHPRTCPSPSSTTHVSTSPIVNRNAAFCQDRVSSFILTRRCLHHQPDSPPGLQISANITNHPPITIQILTV